MHWQLRSEVVNNNVTSSFCGVMGVFTSPQTSGSFLDFLLIFNYFIYDTNLARAGRSL